MALSARDIAAKAAVPLQFQPSVDRAGALSRGFAAAGLSDHDRYNLGVGFLGALADGIDSASPSFILPGPLAAIRERQIAHRIAEQRKDERFALDQMKAALDARIAELDRQLAEIDAALERIRLRRIEIGLSLEAIDEIDRLRRSGKKLDPNNAAHRRLLERSGLTAEQANGDDYRAQIAQRRRDLDVEDTTLETDSNRLLKRRGAVVAARGEALEAKGEIERSDTDEARLLAERRAATVLGARELGDAAYLSEDRGAKLLAAEAVATSAKSEAYARANVLDDPAVLRSSAKAFTPD